MRAPLLSVPNLTTLTNGLVSVLGGNNLTSNRIAVVNREPALQASTFPGEIVTCRLDDGCELRLFCKYGDSYSHRYTDSGHGHRRGVDYEAAAYRHVLQPSQASTLKFYGAHTDVKTGGTWLILEYLDNGVHVSKAPQPAAIGLAARWIGQFHAANEARLPSAQTSFLITYDAEYYLGWARRTSLFVGDLHHRFPWLATLCERYEELVDLLLDAPLTIIHGEYTTQNVLIRGGIVYPVDWESAAIAVGKIDLAILTDGWRSAEIVRQCELEYQRARWPEGPPAYFEQTLGAAQLYVQLRWLGDWPEVTTREDNLWRFEELRSAGERLGLI